MKDLLRLGLASKGEYEDQELLDVVARLPDQHRQLFERLLQLMRDIDLKATQM